MKGLLIKDLKLIMVQKYALLLILVLATFVITRSSNHIFAIAYMTFIGALFALSTVSYDEVDNGNAFLFTLPISRKNYVAEKYLFGLLLGGAFWLFGTLLTVAAVLVRDAMPLVELVRMSLLLLPVLFGLLALMFPFQLKFGGERGRIAIIIAIGFVCMVGVGLQKLAEMFHVDLIGVIQCLSGMGMGVTTAIAIGVGLVILWISYRISVGIMNRKEF